MLQGEGCGEQKEGEHIEMSVQAKKGTKVFATVRVVLDVPLSQPWDGACSIDQVLMQAKNEIRTMLASGRTESHAAMRLLRDAKQIGEPEVILAKFSKDT